MIKLDIKRQRGKNIMTFLQAIVLVQLQRIEGVRTVYSIYHLLKGKKSSQTIQDAHLFNLGIFFKPFPIYNGMYLMRSSMTYIKMD